MKPFSPDDLVKALSRHPLVLLLMKRILIGGVGHRSPLCEAFLLVVYL